MMFRVSLSFFLGEFKVDRVDRTLGPIRVL